MNLNISEDQIMQEKQKTLLQIMNILGQNKGKHNKGSGQKGAFGKPRKLTRK